MDVLPEFLYLVNDRVRILTSVPLVPQWNPVTSTLCLSHCVPVGPMHADQHVLK